MPRPANVSSVIVAEVQKGIRTLAELHQACLDAGLNVQEAQVYAGAQSLASNRKIDRGTAPRTWCALGSAVSEAPSVAPGQPVRTKRAVAVRGQAHSDESVLAWLTENLGEPIVRPKNDYAYCWVLDGTVSAEFMKDKTEKGLNMTVTKWFTFKQGPSTAIGLL